GADRLLKLRLGDGDFLRVAVHSAGRGEHEVLCAGGDQRIQKVNRLANVFAEILARILIRLTDCRFCGEIDHIGDSVAANDAPDQFAVGDIAFIERPELRGPAVAGAQVVQDHRLAPGLDEKLTRVASDIAGAAGDQYGTRHARILRVILREGSFSRTSAQRVSGFCAAQKAKAGRGDRPAWYPRYAELFMPAPSASPRRRTCAPLPNTEPG